MPARELRFLLDQALAGLPADVPPGSLAAFVVANAVTGLEPGAYRYLGEGRFAARGGRGAPGGGVLCLEQWLGADAAALVFLLADRGYRVAKLQAAVAAGWLYLGIYAQCLGASGITFYDARCPSSSAPPGGAQCSAVVLGPEGGRRSIIVPGGTEFQAKSHVAIRSNQVRRKEPTIIQPRPAVYPYRRKQGR